MDYFRIQLMHQLLHFHLPMYFFNCWPINADRREGQEGPALCNEEDIYVPFSCLTSTEFLFLFFSENMDKVSEPDIKSTSNKKAFNKS
jgi:hypothetical protein